MKNNKSTLVIFVIIAIVAVATVIAVILNNQNNAIEAEDQSTNPAASSTASNDNTVLWSENGVSIKKATIEQVSEDSYNIQTVFANSNNEAVEFDNSKFRYELADGYVITPSSTTKTLEANRPYIQFAQSLSKEENSHLHLGDTLTVYYGDTKLQTTTIEKF